MVRNYKKKVFIIVGMMVKCIWLSTMYLKVENPSKKLLLNSTFNNPKKKKNKGDRRKKTPCVSKKSSNQKYFFFFVNCLNELLC